MATKEKKKRPPRSKRPKQSYIPGTAPPSVPEIDKAADAYRDARDARMLAGEEEQELQKALLALMHKNNLTTYEYEDNGTWYTVRLNPVEKVSVKKKPGGNGTVEVNESAE